jgi:tetratricopeptide (TPR) repeat protein
MAMVTENEKNGQKQIKDNIIPFVKADTGRGGKGEQRKPAAERLNDFIQNHRKPIIGCAVCVLVLFAGFIAFLGIRDSLRTKAIGQVEELGRRYEELLPGISGDTDVTAGSADSSEEKSAGDTSAERDALVQELEAFAPKHSGYAGARAYGILADLYLSRKDWTKVREAWTAAATAGVKTYLEPICFFNAAVAAEESGDLPGAIELYSRCVTLADIYPGAPRAQFMIGRLQEEQHDTEAALEAYRALLAKWPDTHGAGNSPWTNVAQGRIIFLSTRAAQ